MTQWVVGGVVAFMSFWGVLLLLDLVAELREERRQPFLFGVGETVIRQPQFPWDIPLVAMSRNYRRYTVVEQRRDFLGRKFYKTSHPEVAGLVKFREMFLMKNV